MAGPLYYDRVMETSTTTGTGTLTLAGAVTGFQTWAAVGDGNTAYYCIFAVDANGNPSGDWEVGLGTYTASGTTLARTRVIASTNSNAAVSFGAGTKRVCLVRSAESDSGDLPPIAVTGATTATIGRRHVCSGTSADYTVTLPAVAGNAGRRIWFAMASGLTKLVTLDGDGSETIDGATTRVMWANEDCELYCDGTTWRKVAGKTIPMFAIANRSASDKTGISASTSTDIEMDTLVGGLTAMWDSGNGRIKVVRPGTYSVVAFAYVASSGGTYAYISALKNGAGNGYAASGLSNYNAASYPTVYSGCAVNDYFNTNIYGNGSSMTVYGSAQPATLVVTEVPSW